MWRRVRLPLCGAVNNAMLAPRIAPIASPATKFNEPDSFS
jgi:hypothetical protein